MFGKTSEKRIALPLFAVVVQAAAAIYFIADGVADGLLAFDKPVSMEVLLESLVAVALLLSVIMGARQLRAAIAQTQRNETALMVAKGAMGELLELRFGEWQLSPSQRDVALFALKGCSVGEIARMRNSAEGTVRSQLSQVYAKAGVSSQAMLMALFIEELV